MLSNLGPQVIDAIRRKKSKKGMPLPGNINAFKNQFGTPPKTTIPTAQTGHFGAQAQKFHSNLLGASSEGSQAVSSALQAMQEQLGQTAGLRQDVIGAATSTIGQGLAGTGDALLSRLVQSSTANLGKGLSDEERTRALQTLQQSVGAQTAARERLVGQQAAARGISGLAGVAPIAEATGAETLAKGAVGIENLNQQIKQQHFKEAAQSMQLATQQDIADRQAKIQSMRTALQTLQIAAPEATDIAKTGIAFGNMMANFEILPAQMQETFSRDVFQHLGQLENISLQLKAQGKMQAAKAADDAQAAMWSGLGSIAGSFIQQAMGSGSVT